MSSNMWKDHSHHQLPIREFAAWLLGGILGLCAGVRVGLIIQNNVGPIIGGTLGWLIVGGSFSRITRFLFRSRPKKTISLAAARMGFMGMLIGTFVSDFIAVKTATSRLAAVIWGPIAGLIVG